MAPGNTADVTVLLPIVDRLRHRFAVGRVCVVADRGMIAEKTIAALEERGLEYVLGARERTDKRVRDHVLDDPAPFTPLLVQRAKGETQLFAKEVWVDKRRYIVCRNEAEAEKGRRDRQAIIEGLDRQLAKGRQGPGRQLGLSALPAQGPAPGRRGRRRPRRPRLRDRRRQAGRRGPL